MYLWQDTGRSAAFRLWGYAAGFAYVCNREATAMKGLDGLNERQRLFVREYLIDHNATKAAERAGYSKRTAYSQGFDLLRKAEIRAAIDHAESEALAALGITKRYILKGLKANAELEGAGHVRNKALELLGKWLGLFTERIDVTSDGKPLLSPLASMTDEELDAHITELTRRKTQAPLPDVS